VPPLAIYLTAEPFEYPRRDWPANVRMVGPCEWDPPAERPAWLDEEGDPLVLVTTSSEFQDDARLVRCALEALADEPLRVVVTMPSSDVHGCTVPSNARVRAVAGVPAEAGCRRAVGVVLSPRHIKCREHGTVGRPPASQITAGTGAVRHG
jgi:UDP:flavonoid glycosyltransferase YjiC (YdhE family)